MDIEPDSIIDCDPDPRAPWRWGLWIGAALALIGLFALLAALVIGPLLSFQEIESKKAPTPADLSPIRHALTWARQGVIVMITGTMMFLLSRSRIRCIDAAQRSPQVEDWSG